MIVHSAGPGSMDSGMVGALVHAGNDIHVRDSSAQAVAAFVASGGTALACGTLKGDAAICVMLNTDRICAASFGPGRLADGLRPAL